MNRAVVQFLFRLFLPLKNHSLNSSYRTFDIDCISISESSLASINFNIIIVYLDFIIESSLISTYRSFAVSKKYMVLLNLKIGIYTPIFYHLNSFWNNCPMMIDFFSVLRCFAKYGVFVQLFKGFLATRI